MNDADRKGQIIAELAALYDVQPEDLQSWLESSARRNERVNKGGRPSVLKQYSVPEERWDDDLDLILANRLFGRIDKSGRCIPEGKAQKLRRIVDQVVDRLFAEGAVGDHDPAEIKTKLEKAVRRRWDSEHDLARAAAADNPPPDLDGDWDE